MLADGRDAAQYRHRLHVRNDGTSGDSHQERHYGQQHTRRKGTILSHDRKPGYLKAQPARSGTLIMVTRVQHFDDAEIDSTASEYVIAIVFGESAALLAAGLTPIKRA
jgi:hypothetical protein